jgi:hypothetical protein
MSMDEFTRYSIVCAIVGIVVVVGLPMSAIFLRKRKREKLRRRGIKTYGH